MSSRKSRRVSSKENVKVSKKAKKQLILMLVSIVLMIFCITQVYYLAKYTLGKEVPEGKLRVYNWVRLLSSGQETVEGK